MPKHGKIKCRSHALSLKNHMDNDRMESIFETRRNDMQVNRMQQRKWAKIIAILIGILAVVSVAAVVMTQLHKGNGRCYAMIYQDGELVEKIELWKVEESYEKTFYSASGGENTVMVSPNSIGVVKADCPDQLCRKQGMTEGGTASVICLPNRLVIEVKLVESTKENLDAVSR